MSPPKLIHAALAIALWAALSPSASGRSAGAEPSGWHEGETAYAQLYAQTDPERAAEIARSLDLFRALFERLAPTLSLSSPVPTRIFAFRDAEAFAPYRTVAQGEGLRVVGQMVAHRDANYILLDADAPLDGALEVVFHEYVHYLVRNNFPAAPRWFNEGLAEYYSTFTVEAERTVVGRPVSRHLRWLAQHELDLRTVLGDPLGSGGRHGVREVGDFYAGSWALVHYLLSGGDERAARMGDFLARIAEGADPGSALQESFDLRLNGLEKAIGEHLARRDFPIAAVPLAVLAKGLARPLLVPAGTADIEVALAEMSVHLGHLDLAERHADRALDADGRSGAAYGVLALIRDHQDRVTEAEQLYRQAILLGSGSPSTYLDYARHLLGGPGGDAAPDRPAVLPEVWRWLDEARRLAPEFAEVDAVRGFSYLWADESVEPGLAALESASRRMPERMDIVLHQAQLWMKAGRFEEAERIVESTLARSAEPELVAAAREELRRRRLVFEANAALARGDLERGIELLDRAISITSDPDLVERMELQLLELQGVGRFR